MAEIPGMRSSPSIMQSHVEIPEGRGLPRAFPVYLLLFEADLAQIFILLRSGACH